MDLIVSRSSKIGEEQTSDDAEDGPPELLVRARDERIPLRGWFLVHSRRSHGEDFGFLVESQRSVGDLLGLGGQHPASLANGRKRSIQHCLKSSCSDRFQAENIYTEDETEANSVDLE